MDSYIIVLLYRTPWACVTELQLHRLRLRVRVYASDCQLLLVHCCRHSVMEKTNSSGIEDGERLIMELMITSHSHEFTQIMQMKSYYELCSVYTLSIHCSDHFQWFIRGKFSMTVSLLARRHRDAEGLILYRCVFFIFFFRRLISEVTERISTKLDIHSHMTAIWKIWSLSNQQSERNSSIYKDFPPPNVVNFGPQTAKKVGEFLPNLWRLRAEWAAGSHLRDISI